MNDGVAMSIGGTEWIVIIFVALVLILGTGRLPGAAKKIGRAVNEYNRAKDGINDHIKQIQDPVRNAPKISGPVESEREKLEIMARAAGLNPDGASNAELQGAIADRMNAGSSGKDIGSSDKDIGSSDNGVPGEGRDIT